MGVVLHLGEQQTNILLAQFSERKPMT